jgi:hypothetical protein
VARRGGTWREEEEEEEEEVVGWWCGDDRDDDDGQMRLVGTVGRFGQGSFATSIISSLRI